MATGVPEWATFFSEVKFAEFVELCEATLHRRGGMFTLDAVNGTWSQENDPQTHSLVPLAQSCAVQKRADWPEVIQKFFAIAGHSTAFPESNEELLDRLRVRLYGAEAVADNSTLKIPLADGLVICLAIDLPDRVAIVPGDRARRLGMSSEQLLDLGMAHVLAKVKPEREERRLTHGTRAISLSSDDFFTTTYALVVDEFAGPEPEHGYLLTVPNRHEVIAVPIDSGRALNTLPSLVGLARDMFQRGPGSLSPYVYWVRKRRWARIEFEETDRGFGISGPTKFVDEVVKPLLQ